MNTPQTKQPRAHLLANLGAVGAPAAQPCCLHLPQPLRLAQRVWRLRPGAQLHALQLTPGGRLQKANASLKTVHFVSSVGNALCKGHSFTPSSSHHAEACSSDAGLRKGQLVSGTGLSAV
jgi:hypothetical protein